MTFEDAVWEVDAEELLESELHPTNTPRVKKKTIMPALSSLVSMVFTGVKLGVQKIRFSNHLIRLHISQRG